MRFITVSTHVSVFLLLTNYAYGAAIKEQKKQLEDTKNKLARLLDEVINYDDNTKKDDKIADQWLKGRFGREVEQWLKGRFGRESSSDQWLKGRFGDQWLKGRFGDIGSDDSTSEQWLKGRFGRELDQWLKGRFGRDAQWLKGRFGREMNKDQWLKGRFGREMSDESKADQWLKGIFFFHSDTHFYVISVALVDIE